MTDFVLYSSCTAIQRLLVLFSWLPNIITVTYFISTFEKHDNKRFKLDIFWYVEVSRACFYVFGMALHKKNDI